MASTLPSCGWAAVVGIFAGGLHAAIRRAVAVAAWATSILPQQTLTRSVWRLISGRCWRQAQWPCAFGWLTDLGGPSGLVLGGLLVGLGIYLPPAAARGRMLHLRHLAPRSATPPTRVAMPYGGLGTSAAGGAGEGPTATFYSRAAAASRAPRQPREPPTSVESHRWWRWSSPARWLPVLRLGCSPLNGVVFFAVLLAIVAAGLLVAARFGRGKWLIIPPFSGTRHGDCRAGHELAHTIDSTVVSAGVGDPTWTPTAPADFTWGVGSPTLDLTTWATSSAPAPTAQTESRWTSKCERPDSAGARHPVGEREGNDAADRRDPGQRQPVKADGTTGEVQQTLRPTAGSRRAGARPAGRNRQHRHPSGAGPGGHGSRLHRPVRRPFCGGKSTASAPTPPLSPPRRLHRQRPPRRQIWQPRQRRSGPCLATNSIDHHEEKP